jgi:hypothetical protein
LFASGLVLHMKCDGRTYRCDIRSTRLRLMAGGYQRDLETKAGEWIDVEAPFDQCDANSVGRRVQNAPALNATSIESVGITLADKKEKASALLGWFVGHWGGLTPPRFQNELQVVNPATPAFILLQLAVISLAFLPWLGGGGSGHHRGSARQAILPLVGADRARARCARRVDPRVHRSASRRDLRARLPRRGRAARCDSRGGAHRARGVVRRDAVIAPPRVPTPRHQRGRARQLRTVRLR